MSADHGHHPAATFGTVSSSWGAPPARRRGIARPGPVAVLVGATMLGLVAAASLLGRPIAPATSVATAFVPPSGTRSLLGGIAGRQVVHEWMSAAGTPVLQSGPAAAGYAAVDFDEFHTNTWVRLTATTADAAGQVSERRTTLFAALPRGLETRVEVWPDRFVAYRPGRLDLPAALVPGTTWTDSGDAWLGAEQQVSDIQPYTARSTLEAAEPGCYRVITQLSIGGEDSTVERTWCSGRGITHLSNAEDRFATVSGPPIWASAQRIQAATAPDWEGSWTFERRNLLRLAPAGLTPNVPPALLPDGLLVYANNFGKDLLAIGWDDGAANARWRAQPGGDVTALLGVGSVVVATTSQRRVAAWGAQGEWLWEAELGDVAAVPTVRFGRLAIVACLDGSVTAFDAETGAVAWRQDLPNEIRLAPVVDGDRVTVLDQAGNLRSIDAAGTVHAAFETAAPEAFTVRGDTVAVASRLDSFVRGHGLDGEVRWRTSVLGGRNDAAVLGEVLVLRQNDLLVALRLTDGVPLWRLPITTTAWSVQGDRLLLADRTDLRLLDAQGRRLTSWQTQEADLDSGAGSWLLADGDQVFLGHTTFAYRRVAR